MNILTQEQEKCLQLLLEKQETWLQNVINEQIKNYYDLDGKIHAKPSLHRGEDRSTIILNIDEIMLHRYMKELHDVEYAKNRIAKDEYGVCITCGREISYARLFCYPTAKRCTECQRAMKNAYIGGDKSLRSS